MAERKYAELTLYYAFCNADGVSEGRFEPENSHPLARRWYNNGLEIVQKYLQPDWKFGLHIVENYLVPDEPTAKSLINFAEENIPNSLGCIALNRCGDGGIMFFRRIKFGGYEESQRNLLIDQLKLSGYEPKNRELEYLRRASRNLFADQKKLEEYLESQGAHPDEEWRKAFKFFN